MSDLMKPSPPILIAETMIVIIPIGAVPRRMLSAHQTDVDKNCFVTSSPNNVRRGAKFENALFSKFALSTVGIGGFVPVTVAVIVGEAIAKLSSGSQAELEIGLF
jgi:hypothetical protein